MYIQKIIEGDADYREGTYIFHKIAVCAWQSASKERHGATGWEHPCECASTKVFLFTFSVNF